MHNWRSLLPDKKNFRANNKQALMKQLGSKVGVQNGAWTVVKFGHMGKNNKNSIRLFS